MKRFFNTVIASLDFCRDVAIPGLITLRMDHAQVRTTPAYLLQKSLLILFIGISIPSIAQDKERAEEFRLQAEQRKRTETLRVLDSAVMNIDHGEYALADKKLVYVLNNIKSVPSDLTFFFGKNSFYLDKYKQSVDWLNKYIQLKGTTGQYYKEAVEILKNAETGLVKERAKDVVKAEQILSSTYDIDCGPAGKVTCPVCKGTTVIIQKGYLNDVYKTCGFCDKHGFLSCDEYNQLIRGELQPRQ
jgi:hypothetical protein